MNTPAPGDEAIRQLDHVVLAVHDLARASDDFRALGFTVTPGGDHAGRSSHNALIVFDDGAYLELKAWRAPAPEEAWWRALQAHGDGLVDHALWPASVPAALAAARARGLDTLRGPVPGHRVRPDGAEVRWDTARHDTPDVPFLCADHTPRALRVPEGAARRHANGATGVATLRLAVHDLARSVVRHQALLGPATPIARAPGVARYRLGGTDFEIFGQDAGTPSGLSAIETEAIEQARAHLARRGEGPFALHLRGAGAAAGVLDAARTHGAIVTLDTAPA